MSTEAWVGGRTPIHSLAIGACPDKQQSSERTLTENCIFDRCSVSGLLSLPTLHPSNTLVEVISAGTSFGTLSFSDYRAQLWTCRFQVDHFVAPGLSVPLVVKVSSLAPRTFTRCLCATHPTQRSDANTKQLQLRIEDNR